MTLTPEKKTAKPQEQDGETEEISGSVESIVFRSESTNYTVATIKVSGRSEKTTVVGRCGAIWVGEIMRCHGKWIRHRTHGLQFQAEDMICVAPTSASGLEKYLASGMIRGIGKVMAKRLVHKFGDNTLRIIEHESARLEEVEGIGPSRRQMIKESWIREKAIRDIMIFLQTHGVGTAQSARIYKQYGSQAIAIISDNPYRLCNDIWGIGFKTADSVARSVGVPTHSPVRARAGIIHVMQTLTEEGHCYSSPAELILQAQALLDVPTEPLEAALAAELESGQLIQEDTHVYLRWIHEAETRVTQHLISLMTTQACFRPIVIDKAIPWAESRMGVEFAPLQSDALRMALSNKVSIITGGPGVGKTTIIRALVDVFSHRRLRVSLAAPTGRAAKRMEEATGLTAMTIHRLLKYNPRMGGFEHDEDNRLETDVAIVDEFSMMDLLLAARFLGALPPGAVLILVGDIDQLPSVGAGNVLRDLIQSDVVPFRRLDRIFRQAHGGLIVQNAHRVNNGEFIESHAEDADSDFYFIKADEPEQVIRSVTDLVTRRIPDKFGYDPMTDVQVLTPMRRNQLGADNLNDVLQDAVNPGEKQIQRYGRSFRRGDRVMQVRNNYDKDVFNGDIGIIADIDEDEQVAAIRFESRVIPYEFSELDELTLAYACSIHKSQGSEYPAVVVLITTQHYKMLQRNLLYTALTRGKNLVCLVGSTKAVGMAIRNNLIRMRRTGLRQRLVEAVTQLEADGPRLLPPREASSEHA